MIVFALPGRRNSKTNPFNYLLSEAIAAEGCTVEEFGYDNGLFGRADVVHLHWPQKSAEGRLGKAIVGALGLITRLIIQRLRGARIVWTVHNVRSHDRNSPWMERALMAVVVRLIHGAVYLSASSRDAAYAEMPALARKPSAVILHGLYGDQYQSPKSRDQARAAFALPQEGRVVGFLGDIIRYKGIEHLLGAFERGSESDVTLFIAGAFPDRAYGDEVRRRIADLQGRGHRVVFVEKRLGNSEMVDAIHACDIVALPYHAIWNSGLALLVLEKGGRLVTSDAPVFRELQAEVGPGRIEIATGDRYDEAMARALAAGTKMPAEALAPGLAPGRSWTEIGIQTVAFYRQLGAS